MKRVRALTVTATVMLLAAACGSSSSPSSSATAKSQHIGGSVTVWAEWTAQEQASFLAALQPFESQTGVTVNYSGKGSNMDTTLESAIQGGSPPDVALSPSPATLQTLAKNGSLKDITSDVGSLSGNYGTAWNQLATYNGKLYGVWFKGANKNTIWYNPAEFTAAGISSPPKTWEELLTDAGQLNSAGVKPFSLCTDVGWPVADFWQNVYVKTAGGDDYNKLAAHTLKWTDPTVTTAFNTMAQALKPENLLGGISGSLSNAFPDCVDKVFPKAGAQPTAAMVVEADFVVSEITSNSPNYAPGTTGSGGAKCTTDPSATPCYDYFPFPAPSADSSNSSSIQSAGDVAMLLNDTPQARALIKYLAGPQGAAIWAKKGGFASPNKAVPSSAYPNQVAQKNANDLANASTAVFSLDDLQGSWEKSMWADLLNFVQHPSDVASIEATMDQQATAALGH